MPITNQSKTPAQRAVERIRSINTETLDYLQNKLTEVYGAFWSNAQGATPQEIASLLATDGPFMLQAHAGLVAQVATVCQHDGIPLTVPTAVPEGWTYTADESGNLVLTPPSVEG